MNYDIFDRVAPAMPRPAKGTEIVKLLLSQASRDMREPLVPMAIPALAAHLTDVEFMYSDNRFYELCGQMGHLVGPSGIGKAQLTHLIEAIMRPFRDHDELEYKKLSDWIRQVKTRPANKEKPERPDKSAPSLNTSENRSFLGGNYGSKKVPPSHAIPCQRQNHSPPLSYLCIVNRSATRRQGAHDTT